MNILIVDDSRVIRSQLKQMIAEAYPEWRIQTVGDGSEALDIIARKPPRIMLLDVIMPKLDGIHVLKQVEKLTDSGKLKVIMITSLTDVHVMKACFDLGAKDFIMKPIRHLELLSRLDGTVKTIRLIDALQNSEKQLKNKIEQVEEINEKLIETRQQMLQQESMAAVGNLAAGVAHEINNPIGFVNSNLFSLQEFIDDIMLVYNQMKTVILSSEKAKSEKELTENIKDADGLINEISEIISETKVGLERVTEIVRGLQRFSQIDQLNEYHTFDINQGIQDTLTVTQNKYKYIADVETDFNDIPSIKAHGGRLNQVFMNLIVNACDAIEEKHMNVKGVIKVSTCVKESMIEIIVKDNGKGILQENLNAIFTPFFSTKEVGKGTGFGLSIAYDIITREHKGTITVESSEGKGATFTINLPIEHKDKE